MYLKGNITIEITDVNTNEKETIVKENMVTNVINDILGTNPMGVFYTEKQYSQGIVWTDNLIPICPNMVGGIMLLSEELTESPDNIYPSANSIVGYASNDVNGTKNMLRGSMNLLESSEISSGYQFVWEFTPSQGNGSISALGLTSALGGKNGYGSAEGDDSTFLKIKSVEFPPMTDASDKVLLLGIIDMDFSKEIAHTLLVVDDMVIRFDIRMPVFGIGLNEKFDGGNYTFVDESYINNTVFVEAVKRNKNYMFFEVDNQYWYGFTNTKNTSGNDKITGIIISKLDGSTSNFEINCTGGLISDVGKLDDSTANPIRVINSCYRGTYLYIVNKAKDGLVKINKNNGAELEIINLGVGTLKPLGPTGPSEVYITLIDDIIIGNSFMVLPDDTVIKTAGNDRFAPLGTPLFKYKEFLIGWGTDYSKGFRSTYIYTPYLASICNLANPVTKTSDKNMKIIYTLTES